jgi:LysR family transcriptional activator of nhaA
MPRLNYHHLYYFWRVATNGNLTRTANALHISQSALSTQIRQLEHSMDTRLFERRKRKLALTEQGQRVLAYANDIFSKGEELEALLRRGMEPEVQLLRIGVLSTMSRNFIDAFISPILRDQKTRFYVYARDLANLLDGLAKHQYDVVLANTSVKNTAEHIWQNQLLARQPVSVVGPAKRRPKTRFPKGYKDRPWVLPMVGTEMRSAFDGFCTLSGFEPVVHAEADDMAMLRLLARDTGALTVLPKVVVRDEIRSKSLVEYMSLPNVYENFYAITTKRQYPAPALSKLLARTIQLTG